MRAQRAISPNAQEQKLVHVRPTPLPELSAACSSAACIRLKSEDRKAPRLIRNNGYNDWPK